MCHCTTRFYCSVYGRCNMIENHNTFDQNVVSKVKKSSEKNSEISFENQRAMSLESSEDIISSIEISKPSCKSGSIINVLYCKNTRPESDAIYDHIYEGHLPDEGGKLSISIPFSGKVSVSANYEILKVDLLDLYLALNSDDGTTLTYDKCDYNFDRFAFKITNSKVVDPSSSSQETTVSWQFQENWKTFIHIPNTTEEITFDIIARISLNVRKINDDGTQSETFRLPVFLTSQYSGTPSDNSIKISQKIKITIRRSAIFVNPYLRSISNSNLTGARFFGASGVARLLDGKSYFLVAGGAITQSMQEGSTNIDVFCIDSSNELTNVQNTSRLIEGKWWTASQVIKDWNGKQYFVVAGGFTQGMPSNYLEVLRVQDGGSLNRIMQQVKLPFYCHSMASTVITDGVSEYIALTGASSGNKSIIVYSVALDGTLLKVPQEIELPESVYIATAGMICNGANRYLIVAGGKWHDSYYSKNVYVYKISIGGVLDYVNKLSLKSARFESVGGTVQDKNGKQYLVIAGGRINDTQTSADIDVFGFDDSGNVVSKPNQPKLSVARYGIAAGVLDNQYFVAAGGYPTRSALGNTETNVIDMFSIGTDGVLKTEKSSSLYTKVGGAASGVISKDGQQYFIVAGGQIGTSLTDHVELFELCN